MIIIPEIETVVILVPRTGSGSLRRAVAAAHPQSMLIYRHMEADGVPAGYDRWRRLGVFRPPVDRLWSLYKFMRDYSHASPVQDQAYAASLRRSAARPFNDWICENETVFTSPYDSAGLGRFWPQFTVKHALPENCKSQFVYLRPDLGTVIHPFDRLDLLERELGVQLGRQNATEGREHPPLSALAVDHVSRFFAWDLQVAEEIR